MIPVRFATPASDDLRKALGYYKRQDRQLAIDLLAEVDAMEREIAEQPRRFAPVTGLKTKLEVRRARLHRFPYALVFAVGTDEILVFAVAHDRENPAEWLERISDETESDD